MFPSTYCIATNANETVCECVIGKFLSHRIASHGMMMLMNGTRRRNSEEAQRPLECVHFGCDHDLARLDSIRLDSNDDCSAGNNKIVDRIGVM